MIKRNNITELIIGKYRRLKNTECVRMKIDYIRNDKRAGGGHSLKKKGVLELEGNRFIKKPVDSVNNSREVILNIRKNKYYRRN